MLWEQLMHLQGAACPCGRAHVFDSRVLSGKGMLERVPSLVKERGATHPYVLADANTLRAAGERLCTLLAEAGLSYTLFCYEEERPEPNEQNVGSAFMHLTADCDLILAVGSGVLNDVGKLLAMHTHLPFFTVATAPSMDGYASMTSSVTLGGIKVSLPSRCADVIVGDIDVIRHAPREMFFAGIGDMLAKYVSICEWRIAALLLGEYYCETVADLVRTALKRTVASAPSALNREEKAVGDIFDALIVSSVAMNYAGISRPASGVEHYVSHLYDTRGIEFGEPTSYHGTQCAIATGTAIRLYERLRHTVPDREQALRAVESFNQEAWNESLRRLLGSSAEHLIRLEEKEGKYNKTRHRERLALIFDHWDELTRIMDEELPSSTSYEQLLQSLGMPSDFASLGMRQDLLGPLLSASGDIRDKYVLPRLLWDLGLRADFTAAL